MKAIIVSDLHLGSKYFLLQHFKSFLENIPVEYDLILNGDVVDGLHESMNQEEQEILALIVNESFHRKVVWVRGNNDYNFKLSESGRISFQRIHSIGNRLIIVHGDLFDKIRTMGQIFFKVFDNTYVKWMRRRNKPVNPTHFARKFNRLYKFYRKTLMHSAVRYARQNGFKAITCGHSHYTEDFIFDGIRYINTGAWTDYPPVYLLVNDTEMSLRSAVNSSHHW